MVNQQPQWPPYTGQPHPSAQAAAPPNGAPPNGAPPNGAPPYGAPPRRTNTTLGVVLGVLAAVAVLLTAVVATGVLIARSDLVRSAGLAPRPPGTTAITSDATASADGTRIESPCYTFDLPGGYVLTKASGCDVAVDSQTSAAFTGIIVSAVTVADISFASADKDLTAKIQATKATIRDKRRTTVAGKEALRIRYTDATGQPAQFVFIRERSPHLRTTGGDLVTGFGIAAHDTPPLTEIVDSITFR